MGRVVVTPLKINGLPLNTGFISQQAGVFAIEICCGVWVLVAIFSFEAAAEIFIHGRADFISYTFNLENGEINISSEIDNVTW